MNAPVRSLRQERDPRLWTADQFLDFYMTRPEGERWQLVDGLAMMMVPPTVRHQRIAQEPFAVARSRARYPQSRSQRCSTRSASGSRALDDFNPEPDLLVIRADASFDRYADQFFLVAEVISPSNTAEMIERKLELYRSHPDNLYCLTIDQDAVHVIALCAREQLGSRRPSLARRCAQARAFGFEAKLADIYKGTPLAR